MGRLYYFVYTSFIAADFPPQEIPGVVRAALDTNRRLGLTGLLIFDGLRFCQYLEGPSAALGGMLTVVSRDPRHVRFQVREHATLLPGQRRFADSPLAYCRLDSQATALDEFGNLADRSAASVLDRLRPTLVLESP